MLYLPLLHKVLPMIEWKGIQFGTILITYLTDISDISPVKTFLYKNQDLFFNLVWSEANTADLGSFKLFSSDTVFLSSPQRPIKIISNLV